MSGYRPSMTVRLLYGGMGIGLFAFLGTLLVGAVGAVGIVLPLGMVAVLLVGQYLAGRTWRMIVNSDMANGFLVLGMLGGGATVLA